MRNLRTRLAIVIVLLALTASFSALALYPEQYESEMLKAKKLPLMLDSWAGQEVAVEQYVLDILETEDVVQRNYASPLYPGKFVQLAVVFSPQNRRVAHPPEVCYRGAGWEVNTKTTQQYEGLPEMVKLTLGRGPKRDLALYCYKAGNDLTANYYQQQINIIRNQIMQRSTSSALIRFSTPVYPDENMEQCEQRLVAFARKMMPEIQSTLK